MVSVEVTQRRLWHRFQLMKHVWTSAAIKAPAEHVWNLMTDVDVWPDWGPTTRAARIDGDIFEAGTTGTVTTVFGIDVRFEVTDLVDGEFWAWKVAGVPATHHTVRSRGAGRCEAGFGVPWIAAPYLLACKAAMRRLEKLATS